MIDLRLLQCGDYVRVIASSPYSSIPYFKVERISPDSVVLLYKDKDCKERRIYAEADELEPLDLTSEFFKRNEFENYSTFGCFVHSLTPRDKRWEIRFVKDEKTAEVELLVSFCEELFMSNHQIAYLHEYQQTLRSCRLFDIADFPNMECYEKDSV